MDDLTSVRDALLYYQRFFGFDPAALSAVEALEALGRVEGRTLPNMPDGWLFKELSCIGPEWYFCMHRLSERRYIEGKGPTPRAAILAAMAKMEWIA